MRRRRQRVQSIGRRRKHHRRAPLLYSLCCFSARGSATRRDARLEIWNGIAYHFELKKKGLRGRGAKREARREELEK